MGRTNRRTWSPGQCVPAGAAARCSLPTGSLVCTVGRAAGKSLKGDGIRRKCRNCERGRMGSPTGDDSAVEVSVIVFVSVRAQLVCFKC